MMAKPANPSRHGRGKHQVPEPVRIDIWSAIGLVDPPILLLEPYLQYLVRQFEEGGALGYQQRDEILAIWGEDHRGRMAIPTGLVPRVQRILEDRGYPVTLTDHRQYGERFFINRKFLRSTEGEDRRLLEAACRQPLGQIEVKSPREMIDKLRKIIFLYPKARVLIPVATRAMAQKIRKKIIQEVMDRNVELLGRSWPATRCRCMVCPFTALKSCRTEEWDIILLPDLRGAVSNVGSSGIARLHGANDRETHRVYGFVQPGVSLGRRGQLRLEAIAGPVIYCLGTERVGVRVLWLPSPDCSKIDRDATALLFKRKAYWHNNNRNDLIAAVARAFVNQDIEKLRLYGILSQGQQPDPQARIAVLVASTEQAREMAKRLPGWKIRHAVPRAWAKLLVATGGKRLGVIITEAEAGKHGLDADVVIRATGSSGRMCFKDFPPAKDADTRNAILMDLADAFDQRALQDARRRRQEYEAMNWENDPEPGKNFHTGKT